MGGGGKGSRCVGWEPYHLHMPIVLKSGSLILFEFSGPVQVCDRIALPLRLRLPLRLPLQATSV
jgi:hypothetical protein